MSIRLKQAPASHDTLIINLHQLMHKHKLSEAALSRATGIPQPTLHKILSGKTNDPRISTLKTLAEFFEISLDDLFSEQLSLDNKKTTESIYAIPLVSWAECLDSENHVSALNANNWEKWITVSNTGSEPSFALATKPSMEPRFPRNSILIIDTKTQADDGDLVIAHYTDTNEATLRELSIDGPTQLLISPNHLTSNDILDNNISLLGVVIQSRFNYEK